MTDYLLLYWNVASPNSLVHSPYQGRTCEPHITTDDTILSNFEVIKKSNNYDVYDYYGNDITVVQNLNSLKNVLINFVFILPEIPPFTNSAIEVGISAYYNVGPLQPEEPNCAALSQVKYVNTFYACNGQSQGCRLLYGLGAINLNYDQYPTVGPEYYRFWSIFLRPTFPIPDQNIEAYISFSPY
jgi:hypothetical protein